MHGLINKALQSYVCHTYGLKRWHRITESAGLGFAEFEAMLIYEDAQTDAVLAAMCGELGRTASEVLEDLGTHLVSHPELEALRRLLRFGGETYVEFLHSLDALPERARLAVSDLQLPGLELSEHASGQYSLTCAPGLPGFGHVLCGILRAMADDYGALVILKHEGKQDGHEVISVTLVESAFAKGRTFELGARA